MKKKMCILFALLAVVNLCVPAFATTAKSEGFDTLSFSMDEYCDSAKPSSWLFIEESDEEVIQDTCEAFIAVGRASVRNPEYTIAALSDCSQQQVKYRQSEFLYLSALYNAENVEILSDNLTFSDFEAEIADDEATASIVEKYTYYTNDFDGYNFRMRKYTFSLMKDDDDTWVIKSVKTDDPWETNAFSYEPYNPTDAIAIANTTLPVSTASEVSRIGEKSATASSLYKWTYNTAAAVEYAEEFCNATASGGYNDLFPFIRGDDNEGKNCQNFASQCVWAGLIGSCDTALMMTSYTTLPAVSSSRVGKNAVNVWCYGDTSTALGGCSWYSSTRFAKMIDRSTTTTEGPFGNTHYGNLKYADVGDVIHIVWSGAEVTESSTLDHAMFVTQVTGRVGSRTVSNLKIAANSSHTNTAYTSLTSYAPNHTDESFSTSVIDSGYYSSPRNFN